MNIQVLNDSNFEEIKALFRDVFMNEPWNDDWSDDSQLSAYIMDLTGNRNSLSVGLYNGGKLVGISLGSVVHWCTGTEYYIYEFCIDRNMQGKGMGSFFMKEIEELIKTKGVNHIFLQTEKTVSAYNFYTKRGFTDLEDHKSLVKMI